jgi:galactokinase
VNLIGDHTDYNDGFVLPVAIDLGCVVHAEPRADQVVRVQSDIHEGDAVVELSADGSDEPREVTPPGQLVAGLVRVLASRGRPPAGVDLRVTSTLPVGVGLSSSAAFSVAVALALCDAARLRLDARELASSCQHAERLATGVPCGIMDPLAALSGRKGCAMLIDCRTLAIDDITLPAELEVLVIHSGVRRSLAHTAYAERRAACERAARRLGVRALRDATPAQVEGDLYARHVVAENERVLAFAAALRTGALDALGPLLAASHSSLRNDFGVSTPELDALVEALVSAGAVGARLTGAGFGGCVVALVRRSDLDAVIQRACDRYRDETGIEPWAHICTAVDGAGSTGSLRSWASDPLA